VVMASEGYPGDYRKGDEIAGLDKAAEIENLVVFHAGTSEKDGNYFTNGGRVLGVTAVAPDVAGAIELAYKGVNAISWQGVHFRRDIGSKALK